MLEAFYAGRPVDCQGGAAPPDRGDRLGERGHLGKRRANTDLRTGDGEDGAFRTHFVEAMRTFVRSTFVPISEPTLVEHVMASMAAAPPHIGISAAEEAWGSNRLLREGLQEVTAPKIAINNSSFVMTDMEAAQRHGIEVLLTSGVGHFVMLEDPQTFNRLLDEAV